MLWRKQKQKRRWSLMPWAFNPNVGYVLECENLDLQTKSPDFRVTSPPRNKFNRDALSKRPRFRAQGPQSTRVACNSLNAIVKIATATAPPIANAGGWTMASLRTNRPAMRLARRDRGRINLRAQSFR